jgi:hypothetical protein
MSRTIAIALSGILAFTSFAQAQYYPPVVPPNPPVPVNSRYLPDSPPAVVTSPASQTRSLRTGRLPSVAPATTTRDDYFKDDFYPLAFIQRVYLDVLGREPSDEEASYWLRQMRYQSRRDIYLEMVARRPVYGPTHYDPRWGQAVDPGYGSSIYPDPASLNFRDPGGPYFKSPYFPNYESRRPIRAFPLSAQG